jgi:hypothetical protein
MGSKVLFDNRHAVYKSKNAARTAVLVTFNQLQACSESTPDKRKGLFSRIIIDEAQAIRRCDLDKQCRILKSFEARFRGIYTEVPSSSRLNRYVQPASDCHIQ